MAHWTFLWFDIPSCTLLANASTVNFNVFLSACVHSLFVRDSSSKFSLHSTQTRRTWQLQQVRELIALGWCCFVGNAAYAFRRLHTTHSKGVPSLIYAPTQFRQNGRLPRLLNCCNANSCLYLTKLQRVHLARGMYLFSISAQSMSSPRKCWSKSSGPSCADDVKDSRGKGR